MASTLHRPRLSARLDHASRGRLTVLTAPAGYGKTVAVEQWTAQHDGQAVWIRISRSGGAEDVLRTVDQLEASDADVVVVDALDDARDPLEGEALARTIERWCRTRPVVVTRRARQPLSLNRLMMTVDATEMGPSELAFTDREARDLLRLASDGSVEQRHVDRLMERTEGWAFPLRIAAVAIGRGSDPDQVVESISGANRHIASLFGQELLRTQPRFIRRFLIETSILDALTGPLCDAVVGGRASTMMLKLLEHRGLFTERTTADGWWFRYHPLFRESLQRELRITRPDAETVGLRRAANWSEGNGDIDRALRYLAQAGHWGALLDTADRCGRVMFERGNADVLSKWLDAVPSGAARDLSAERSLALRRLVVATTLGRTRRARQVMHEMAPLSAAERAICDTMRASWMFMDAQPNAAITAADSALAALRSTPHEPIPNVFGLTSTGSLQLIALGARGRALWAQGDSDGARADLQAVLCKEDGYVVWRTHALSSLAIIEAWDGNLRVSQSYTRGALREVRAAELRSHPAAIDAHLAAAHVLRERGHVGRAEAFLDEAQRIALRTRRPISVAMHAVETALVCLSSGKHAHGLQTISSIRSSGEPPLPRIVDARLTAAEIALLLAERDVETAQALLDRATRPWPDPVAAVAVRLALDCRDLDKAARTLESWQPSSGSRRALADHALLTAMVEFETGRRRQALTHGAVLVGAAKAEGDVALFTDAGRTAERLLRALAVIQPDPYVVKILRYLSVARGVTSHLGLSDRELDVVRYLPGPLSNAEIAAQLFVSLNTLKTHLRSIYRKLGVSNRRDAIQRAEDLGLA